MKALIRAWALGLVRLFYPWRSVRGLEHLPAEGPVLIVANHPNGLVDPLLVRVAVGRAVSFLGKSTFWDNPVSKLAMDAFGALPVYRAHEADTARNEATFAACHALLRRGGWLALFPEGKSHDETTLQPLKTGAARIALGAGVPVRIVPVGLIYDDKATFRSAVSLVIGRPLEVGPGLPSDRAAVEALTGRIDDALGDVVLEADDATLWRAFLVVASWTGATTLADRERRARALAEAWRRLFTADPAAAETVVAEVRRFQANLGALGVRDPFAVEAALPTATAAGLAFAALLAPFALAGAVLAWVPYRLVRPLSVKLAAGHADVVGTIKLLLGFVVLFPVWLLWIAVAAAWGGPLAALGMTVAAPVCGLAALRFDEIVTRRADALRGITVRLFRPQVALALAERRRELTARLDALRAATDA